MRQVVTVYNYLQFSQSATHKEADEPSSPGIKEFNKQMFKRMMSKIKGYLYDVSCVNGKCKNHTETLEYEMKAYMK